MKQGFQASFWELAAAYAAGAHAIGDGVCLWGCVQHALPVMLVGAAIAGYWAVRSLECLASAISILCRNRAPFAPEVRP